MAKREFRAKLSRFEGVGTWTFVKIPFDVEKYFGKGGQVKVKAAVDGADFRSSLMPDGDGQHFLVVPKSVRDKAKVKVGDRVAVVVESDPGPRLIEAPPDLAKALGKNKTAKAVWDEFAYSHKKAYVDWIVAAKKAETRVRRIENAVLLIADKKAFK
jgi:bifunctional DNA-binding transcriptional regulator/antitoxin component of YhaV-PrlF toxin-antitoxin module